MKLKNLVHFALKKPRPKIYDYTIKSFELDLDGHVEYAQWNHPSESEKRVDQREVNELREFLLPGDVAIDIGAHTGDSTLPMALAVGPQGVVLALEPNKYVFPVLKKNSELNADKTAIVPLMFAATEVDSEFDFEYSDAGFCNGGYHKGISPWKHGHLFKLEVIGKNLDRYLVENHPQLIPKVKYIKTDCDGYDLEVVKSLFTLINDIRPYLKVEVYKWLTDERRRELYELICNLGYKIMKCKGPYEYRGQILNIDDLRDEKNYDIFAVPKEFA